MGLLAVVNPSKRRRRRRKGASSRRRVRKMTAKQLRYFGPKRRRNPVHAINPRRRRRSVRARRARRSFRRNPAGAPRFRVGYITDAIQSAAIGAGGALAVDFTMAQAARALPVTMTSRMNAEGGINLGYYATKIGIAVGLGVLGTQMLPGRWRMAAAKATAGSLTVQAYEVLRGMLPADVVLGYFTPAPVVGNNKQLAAYMSTRRALPAGAARGNGMGAYYSTRSTPMSEMSEARIGEGAIS